MKQKSLIILLKYKVWSSNQLIKVHHLSVTQMMEQMIFKVLQYRSWITRWRLACKRYLWRCQLRLKVDQRSHRSRLQSLEAKVGKLENKLHSNQCRTPHPILPQSSYHQSRTLPLQMTTSTQKLSHLLKTRLNLKLSLSRSKPTNCSSRRTNYAKSP